MGNSTTRMVFEGEPTVKLHAYCQTSSRLAQAQIETPDKTKSPWEGFTVLDLQTTKALVLLG